MCLLVPELLVVVAPDDLVPQSAVLGVLLVPVHRLHLHIHESVLLDCICQSALAGPVSDKQVAIVAPNKATIRIL